MAAFIAGLDALFLFLEVDVVQSEHDVLGRAKSSHEDDSLHGA